MMPKRTEPSISRISGEPKDTKMRHEVASDINCTEYFYDGEVEVVNSVAVIPADKPHWVNRMRMNGYEIVEE
jgi:hypothetical protein